MFKPAECVCALVLCAAFPSQAAPLHIDWEDGQWTHGASTFLGYQQPTILPAVGTPYAGTTHSGNVTVDWTRYGTATGTHSGIGGIQPRVSAAFAGASTDGAISLGTASDSNGGVLNNYVVMRILFTQAAGILPFVIGDVDRTSATGTSWEDFIAVVAFNSATPVPVSYTTTPGANILHTRLGLDGVLGTNSIANNTDGGNVLVAPASPVTSMLIYFFQGPNGTGAAAHGVFMRDIDYVPFSGVPEPGTLPLLAAPLALIALRLRRVRAPEASRRKLA